MEKPVRPDETRGIRMSPTMAPRDKAMNDYCDAMEIYADKAFNAGIDKAIEFLSDFRHTEVQELVFQFVCEKLEKFKK